MADQWTVSVAQYNIAGGAQHNIILIRDGAGTLRAQINGGPQGPDGRLANWPANADLFLPGAAPLRAQVDGASGGYYQRGLPEQTVLVGSEADIRAALQAGFACVNDINNAGYRYGTLTINSNSVANTVLQCMGIILPSDALLALSAPGFGRTLLSEEQINQTRQENGLPPAGFQRQNFQTNETFARRVSTHQNL
jgi:hypothetical protein